MGEAGEGGYAAWKAESHQLFELAPMAILVFDDELRYLDANPAACELLRRSKEDIVGRKVGDFSESDGTRLAEKVREAAGTCVVAETLNVALDDGSTRVVELETRPNLLPGIHLSFSHDITQRQQLQRELERHNRLEAIGQVAAGVAHDFNNMLTAILSYVDLQLASGQEEKGRRYAIGIRAAAERAAETTRQLLAFCRGHNTETTEVNVNEVIREATRLARRLISEDIAISLALDPTSPTVMGDPSRLNQVLLNLLVNARDAMPNGGQIVLKTARKAGARGEQVSISVHDNGTGIHAEILPHIFDPFFTTKPHGKGTGLGLSTVYGIVKQSNGEILVNSDAARGTTFEVVLPAASGMSREYAQHG